MCVAFTPLFWLSHFCLQSYHLFWLSLPVLDRVLYLCCYCDSLGPPWAWIESDHVFTRVSVILNHRALSLCCSLRSFSWWAGPAVRLIVCPLPTAGYDCYGWLSSHLLRQKSLWNGAGPCCGCLHTARLAGSFWIDSCHGYVGGFVHRRSRGLDAQCLQGPHWSVNGRGSVAAWVNCQVWPGCRGQIHLYWQGTLLAS